MSGHWTIASQAALITSEAIVPAPHAVAGIPDRTEAGSRARLREAKVRDGPYLTSSELRRDLEALGLGPGDAVMVHAAVSRIGRMLGGPDTLIGALRDTIGTDGTILAYADWNVAYDELLDARGRVPEAWRDDIPAFDPARSRAARENGVFPEFLRTTPGALRSGNPGASIVALGGQATHFVSDHALDYGYGEGSPYARLVAADGKVLMLGAPLDAMTLLHHAEHLAKFDGKRVRRYKAPLMSEAGRRWVLIEEFETAVPVAEGLADDHFTRIVDAYLQSGRGVRNRVGGAGCVLVGASGITSFAVDWLQRSAFGTDPT